MGPRLRAGLSGEKLQSLRRYLRDAGFWHSQAVETRNHELDSFESLESVPRTGLRLRGDDAENVARFVLNSNVASSIPIRRVARCLLLGVEPAQHRGPFQHPVWPPRAG